MLKKTRAIPRTSLERARDKLTNYIRLRWACRGMILFGFLTSAGGNVLHAEHAPIPIGLSLLAPGLLLFAFEMLSRIPLPPSGLKWYSLRYWGTGVRILAMVTIAAITVIISYRHQSAAFMKYGNDQMAATLLPGAIDAFMLVGSLSVLEIMIFIRGLEDKIAAMEMMDSGKVTEVPDTAPKPERVSKKERIATAMVEMPWASAKEIQAVLQTRGLTVNEGYVANVMSELRKAQRTNGHLAEVPATN